MKALLFVIGLMYVETLLACGTGPTPIPDPPPAPAGDVFDGAIINCELPTVAAESPALEAPVRACLVGDATSACLVGLTESYHVDAVACVVRMQGVDANRRVLAERPGVDDVTVDEAARRWISQKGLGYR